MNTFVCEFLKRIEKFVRRNVESLLEKLSQMVESFAKLWLIIDGYFKIKQFRRILLIHFVKYLILCSRLCLNKQFIFHFTRGYDHKTSQPHYFYGYYVYFLLLHQKFQINLLDEWQLADNLNQKMQDGCSLEMNTQIRVGVIQHLFLDRHCNLDLADSKQTAQVILTRMEACRLSLYNQLQVDVFTHQYNIMKTIALIFFTLFLLQTNILSCPSGFYDPADGSNKCRRCPRYFTTCTDITNGAFAKQLVGYSNSTTFGVPLPSCSGGVYYHKKKDVCTTECKVGCYSCTVDYDFCIECQNGYSWGPDYTCLPTVLGLEAASLTFLAISLVFFIVFCYLVNKARKQRQSKCQQRNNQSFKIPNLTKTNLNPSIS